MAEHANMVIVKRGCCWLLTAVISGVLASALTAPVQAAEEMTGTSGLVWMHANGPSDRPVMPGYVVDVIGVAVKPGQNIDLYRHEILAILDTHGIYPDDGALAVVSALNPWLLRESRQTVQGDVLLTPRVSGDTVTREMVNTGYRLPMSVEGYKSVMLSQLGECADDLNYARTVLLRASSPQSAKDPAFEGVLDDIRQRLAWCSSSEQAVRGLNFVEMGTTGSEEGAGIFSLVRGLDQAMKSGTDFINSVPLLIDTAKRLVNPSETDMSQIEVRVIVDKAIATKPVSVYWMTYDDLYAYSKRADQQSRTQYLKASKRAGISCADVNSGSPIAFPTTEPVLYAGEQLKPITDFYRRPISIADKYVYLERRTPQGQ